MQIKYYNNNILQTTILVDYKNYQVSIQNHTDDIIHLAFGVNKHPTFTDYENFLESRCFPRSRANCKELLRQLDIPYYDPIAICEKTKGKMAEDNSYMEINWDIPYNKDEADFELEV